MSKPRVVNAPRTAALLLESLAMAVASIVLGAGRGTRLGLELPKAYVRLAGRSLFERSLSVMASVPEVDFVQPVIGRDDEQHFAALRLAADPRRLAPIRGGRERQDSVAAGLEALPDSVAWVAVHDAARCLVSTDDVRRVLVAAQETGAALLALPVRDTIKRVRDGVVIETPDRSSCWVAQTPQVFRRDILGEALEKARADSFLGTDDAQLVERLGVAIAVVPGSEQNLKITVPEDLAWAERWLDVGGQS